jgi:hypothetical protein
VIVIAAAVVMLTSCAQLSRNVEHSFAVENVGTEPISRVEIQYSARKITFCETQCYGHRSGSSYGVYMPIQRDMLVTWATADGSHHHVRVPLVPRIKEPERLDVLFLQFNGGQLTVLQGLHYANPGLAGLERVPLYP